MAKLQRHLALLRQEYVKLQNRHGELEQKYNMAASAAGHLSPDHFVSRLMHTVEELFDRDLYRWAMAGWQQASEPLFFLFFLSSFLSFFFFPSFFVSFFVCLFLSFFLFLSFLLSRLRTRLLDLRLAKVLKLKAYFSRH